MKTMNNFLSAGFFLLFGFIFVIGLKVSENSPERNTVKLLYQVAYDASRYELPSGYLDILDGWGAPIKVVRMNDAESNSNYFVAISAGPDGLMGNDDDIRIVQEYKP